MQGKFRFSLDGADATARQFAEVRRQLRESQANIGGSVRRLGGRVTDIENDFESLTTKQSQADVDESNAVVVPSHGGTGVRNAFDSPLSLTPLKPVYVFYDGTLGVDCSSVCSVAGVTDADESVSLDALRQVKWKTFWFNDDLNQKLDDAQPIIGLLAEDLDDAGLGFFCEYDDVGNVTGVDYPKLSVAALRLAQESMDEVDKLKAEVSRLSSIVGKMGVSTSE